MSTTTNSDAYNNKAAEDVGGKPETRDEQLSPFHVITIPRSFHLTEQTSGLDSPRADAPKNKKVTTACSRTVLPAAPARRGRRAKNCAKKKTHQTTTSSNLESDKVHLTVDGKISDKTSTAFSGDDEKIDVKSGMVDGGGKSHEPAAKDSEVLVSGKTDQHFGKTLDVEATGDVEKKEPSQVMVKGRRCISVPARNSRLHGNRRHRDTSHKITEYFPIRRSFRMTSTELKKQELNEIQQNIRNNKHDGLQVVEIPCKGRGVVAKRPFKKGEFVVEYAGDLVDLGVAKQRETNYSSNQHVGCYMYYFQHKNRNYCVDATGESGLLGRLVNHSRLKFNCATKVVEVDSEPRLILVAARDIRVDEELLYDYGDRSKESLEAYPWLAT